MIYPDSTTRKIYGDKPINNKIAARIIKNEVRIQQLRRANSAGLNAEKTKRIERNKMTPFE